MSQTIIVNEKGEVTGRIFITDYDPLNAWIAEVSRGLVNVVQVDEQAEPKYVRPKAKTK